MECLRLHKLASCYFFEIVVLVGLKQIIGYSVYLFLVPLFESKPVMYKEEKPVASLEIRIWVRDSYLGLGICV